MPVADRHTDTGDYSIRFRRTSQAVELGALPPRTRISPLGRDCLRFTTSLPLPTRETSTSGPASCFTMSLQCSLMGASLVAPAGEHCKLIVKQLAGPEVE